MLFSCQKKTGDKHFEAEYPTIESIDQIELLTNEGLTIDWKQYKGKIIFLNFWATWCGPCIKEMPSIQQVQELLSDHNIVFLLATEENFDKINSFNTRHKLDLKFVRQKTSLAQLDITALPTTYIFDTSGSLVFKETSSRMWNDDENVEFLNSFLQPL